MIKNPDSTSRQLPFLSTHALTARMAIFLASLLMIALAGCGSQQLENLEESSVDAGPSEVATSDDADEVAIMLDGRAITVREVDQHMMSQFMAEFAKQPADKQFSMRETAARDLVQSIVVDAEAKKRGVSSDELREEIVAAAARPTSEEIAAWYNANQSRLRGARLEDVSGQIEQLLVDERKAKAFDEFLGPRLEAMSMRMVLAPPRQEFESTRLVRGKIDAPVTIITFSDYQCPYCILAEPVLTEVLSRYPDDVRIVHRHFPLDSIHAFARPAAEASMCADEQGKFWAFHQGIFDLAGKLNDKSLAKIGSDVGLDTDKLKECVEERRFKDYVDIDFAAGRAAGVTGTPSFFINGVTYTGPRDADSMSRQVDLELARIEGK